MRLAFVSIMNGADWAACEELWSNAALHALRAGHEVFVSVYVRAAHAPRIAELRAAGARIDLRANNSWVRKWALIAEATGAFKPLADFRADAICISQGGTYDIARSGNMRVLQRYLRRSGKPYVLLCHCEQHAPRGGRLRRARRVLPEAFVVGMLASNLHALSERHLGCSLGNTRLFQNPLKLHDPQPQPWPDDTALRMAFVARLEQVKGLDLLIDVLAQPPWRERNWRLTVCGAGPERDALEERVRSVGLAEHIHFAGFVTDIVAVWRDHHVLVMPSRFEGLPIAMMEAMLCGRAVVATDIGGIREWLHEGRSGFLIREPTVADVSAALERLWSHRNALQVMGRHAYDDTRSALDPDPGATLVEWLVEAAENSVHRSTSVTIEPARSDSI